MALLIQVIVLLLVCGMLVWVVNNIPSLPAPVKTFLAIGVVLVCAIFLLKMAGIV